MLEPPRRLQDSQDNYEPIRLLFYYQDFDLGDTQLNNKFYQAFDNLKPYIENLLRLIKVQQVVSFRGIDNCGDQIEIPQEHKTPGAEADLVVYVSSLSQESTIDAYSSMCIYYVFYRRPVAGRILINAQRAAEHTQAEVFSIVLHSITHILGFSTWQWDNFIDQNLRRLDYQDVIQTETRRGRERYILVTEKVKEMTQQYFGCQGIEGMELQERQDGPGSHWKDRAMWGDIMIQEDKYDLILSNLTLALLQDTGHWKVNWEMGEAPIWGADQGCDFFYQPCLEDEVPLFDEFCTDTDPQFMCDFYHFRKAYCSINTGIDDIPQYEQYFEDPTKGSIQEMDYCPYKWPYPDGNCRNLQSIATQNSHGLEEQYCEDCRCFLTTLESQDISLGEKRADCFKVLDCYEDSFSVQIGSSQVLCQTEGQVEVTGYYGLFECPNYQIICGNKPCLNFCTGRGYCNQGVCVCNQGQGGSDCSIECDISCYNCLGESESQCTSCAQGYDCIFACQPENCQECDSESQGTKCQKCQEGYGLTEEQYCKPCSKQNCKQCFNDWEQCQICQDMFGFTQDQSQCKECQDTLCIDCNPNFQYCDDCQEGYTVFQGICTPCDVDNCLTCSLEDSLTCLACQQGFGLDTNNGCQQCIDSNCVQCFSNYEQCQSCIGGFGLDTEKKCKECQDQNCQECFQNFQQCQSCMSNYGVNQTFQCQQCQDQNCILCNTDFQSCTQCQQRTRLTSSFDCELCEDEHCLNCDERADKCDNCQDQLYWDALLQECIQCQVQNCEYCQDNDAEACQTCQSNFYLTLQSKCFLCEDKCKECERGDSDDQSVCKECKTFTEDFSSQPVLVEGVCECDQNSYEIEGVCYQLCDLCTYCDQQSCDCVQNASFDSSKPHNQKCSCNSDFFKNEHECVEKGNFFDSEDIQASFNEEFDTIEVSFDQSSNEYSNDCSNLIVQQSLELLDSPTCEWVSDSLLQIELGSDYTLDFSGQGMIELNWKNIRKTSDQVFSSEFEILLIEVQSNQNYPKPVANAQGVQQYSLSCATKDLQINGQKSEVKSKNKPQYLWQISTQDGQISSDLLSAAFSQTSNTLKLSKTLFSKQGKYKFQFIIQNKFGQTDSDVHQVLITNENSLSVSISDSKAKIYAYEQRQFIAFTEELCGQIESPSYSWEYLGIQQTSEFDFPDNIDPNDLLENSIRQHILSYKPYQLAVGFTYFYQVTSTTSQGISGQATLQITVLSSDVEAKIKQTGQGQHNLNLGISLDASESRDLNSQDSTLVFSWDCIEIDDQGLQQFCTGLNEEPLFVEEDQNVLEVDSDLLKEGDVYTFIVTVSEGEREDSESVTLTMIEAEDLFVTFELQTNKIEVSRPLLIQAIIQGSVQTIQWTQLEGPSIDLSDTSNTSFLLFQPYSLQREQTYSFQITVSNSNTQLKKSVSIETNKTPFCSDLSTSSDQAFTNFQEFTLALIECEDQDEDTPLKYSFGVMNRGLFRTLSYPSQKQSVSFLLYPSSFTVGGKVCDSIFGCQFYFQEVTSDNRRVLQDQDSIIELYDQANSDQDLIPFNTLIFSDYYSLNKSQWDYFLDTLREYSRSLQKIDESIASSVLTAVVSLLFQTVIDQTQIIQGLEYVQEVIQQDEDFLQDEDIELIYMWFDDYILKESISENIEILNEILSVIEFISNNRRQQKPPFTNPQIFTHSQIQSKIQVFTGQELQSIDLEIGDVTVSISNIEGFEDDSLFLALISYFPQAGEFSDIVDLSFYQHGTYQDYQLNIEIGQYRDLQNLSDNIEISFPCNIPQRDRGLYECLVYEQEKDIWESDKCLLYEINQEICSILTSGTSVFQISLISENQDEGECFSRLIPLWVLLGLLVLGSVFIAISCMVNSEIKKYNPNIKSIPQIQAWQDFQKKPTNPHVLEKLEGGSHKLQISKAENQEIYQEKPQSTSQKGKENNLEEFQERPIEELPNRSRCSQFVNHHLLFGQLKDYYIKPTPKAASLFCCLIMNLAFIGVQLQLFQDTENQISEIDKKFMSYIYISFQTTVCTHFFILFLDFLMYKGTQSVQKFKIVAVWWVFVSGLSIVAIVTTIVIGLNVCEDWDFLWVVLFEISAFLELLVLETIVALVKIAISVPLN